MKTATPFSDCLTWSALRASWPGDLPQRVSFRVLSEIAEAKDSTRTLHRTVALVLATSN